MARQRLSEKKERAIEVWLGKSVKSVWSRGGWPHFVVEVWLLDGSCLYVNRREKRIVENPWSPGVLCAVRKVMGDKSPVPRGLSAT